MRSFQLAIGLVTLLSGSAVAQSMTAASTMTGPAGTTTTPPVPARTGCAACPVSQPCDPAEDECSCYSYPPNYTCSTAISISMGSMKSPITSSQPLVGCGACLATRPANPSDDPCHCYSYDTVSTATKSGPGTGSGTLTMPSVPTFSNAVSRVEFGTMAAAVGAVLGVAAAIV